VKKKRRLLMFFTKTPILSFEKTDLSTIV
jgi:hypothetical protein